MSLVQGSFCFASQCISLIKLWFLIQNFIEEFKHLVPENCGFDYRDKSLIIAVNGVSDYEKIDATIQTKELRIKHSLLCLGVDKKTR